MRQSGRGNWILLALIVVIVAIVALVGFSGESATFAGNRFMSALATADAETLTDMSYFNPPRPREQVLSDWKKTLDIGHYYRFIWNIKSSKSPAPGRSSVQMDLTRDAEK